MHALQRKRERKSFQLKDEVKNKLDRYILRKCIYTYACARVCRSTNKKIHSNATRQEIEEESAS